MPESGKTNSAWTDVERPSYPRLEESLNCDVCVVGAGITGLTCAYLLAKSGKIVVVLDSGKVVSGETQRTTAHISDVIDDTYQKILKIYGEKNSRLIQDSLTKSIDLIEKIVTDESIDCDFSRLKGYLWLAESTRGQQPDFLTKELEAAPKAGFTAVESIGALDEIYNKPSALAFPKQAQFHVVKYLNGICGALGKMDVKIFQDSRVDKIEPKNGANLVLQNGKNVRASDVIIATNGPIIDFSIQTKQAAYRSFVVALRIAKNIVPDALYWDTEDPYHYVRKQSLPTNSDEELLIIGGEDHRVGEHNDADERFTRLENWAKEIFQVKGETVYKWSGQVYEPTDFLGFIGRDPELGEHIYVATGDSGMGITNGTIAGIVLTDQILGRENPWADVYKLSRQTPKALPNYIAENAHSLSHYKENFSSKTVLVEDIARGEGGLTEYAGKKSASYRSPENVVQNISPYCTHMGGVVCWNSCESSWDCPVHGSRFTSTGEKIYGPADGDLKPLS